LRPRASADRKEKNFRSRNQEILYAGENLDKKSVGRGPSSRGFREKERAICKEDLLDRIRAREGNFAREGKGKQCQVPAQKRRGNSGSVNVSSERGSDISNKRKGGSHNLTERKAESREMLR